VCGVERHPATNALTNRTSMPVPPRDIMAAARNHGFAGLVAGTSYTVWNCRSVLYEGPDFASDQGFSG